MMFFRVWNGSLWLILHLFISLIYHLPYLFLRKEKENADHLILSNTIPLSLSLLSSNQTKQRP